MAFNNRSKNVTQGVARAPNRSMYYAMGYKEEDFEKPMVGVANGHSTITPCNSGLQPLADAAVTALKESGANPHHLRWHWHGNRGHEVFTGLTRSDCRQH